MYSNHTGFEVSNLRKTQGACLGVENKTIGVHNHFLFHVCCMEDGDIAFLKTGLRYKMYRETDC